MFPRVIHLMWFQGIAHAPDGLHKTPDLWKKFNPGWEIRLWDEHSLASFIRREHPTWFQEWSRLSSIIKKCDLGRLLIVYTFGGLYVDLDLIPNSPVVGLLKSGVRRFNRLRNSRVLMADFETPELINYESRELILSREHRPIDGKGYGIANGMILAKPMSGVLMDFIKSRRGAGDKQVLEAYGPKALTHFVRFYADSLRDKVTVLPPFYFLWEDRAFDEAAPNWVVSRHMAKNYWGDKTKKDWWNSD